MPFKFRTKAELKQMYLAAPASIAAVATPPPAQPTVPAQPTNPIINDEEWSHWSKSLTNEWESFIKELEQSTNIRRIRR